MAHVLVRLSVTRFVQKKQIKPWVKRQPWYLRICSWGRGWNLIALGGCRYKYIVINNDYILCYMISWFTHLKSILVFCKQKRQTGTSKLSVRWWSFVLKQPLFWGKNGDVLSLTDTTWIKWCERNRKRRDIKLLNPTPDIPLFRTSFSWTEIYYRITINWG